MLITQSTGRWAYTGNGATTLFAYTSEVYAAADLAVYVDGVLKLLNSDYTVTNVGVVGGGNVSFTTAPANATKVTIVRNEALSQATDFIEGDTFPANSAENALGKLTLISQMLNERDLRTPRLKVQTTYSNLTIDDPVASQILRWKGDLTGIESIALSAVTTAALTATLTAGRVAFASSSINIDTDINLKWDDTNFKLNIGDPSNTQGLRMNLWADVTVPTALHAITSTIIDGVGDNATAIGVSGGYIATRDRANVTGANKGLLYGLQITVSPIVARNNTPFDDAAGLVVQNGGIAKATDALYVGRNAGIAGSEWYGAITIDGNSDWVLRANGTYASTGVDMSNATITSGIGFKLKNTHTLAGRNAANNADLKLVRATALDKVRIGDDAVRTEVGRTPSTNNGILSGKQAADTEDILYLQRFTDTTPTGSFIRCMDAAGSVALFDVKAAPPTSGNTFMLITYHNGTAVTTQLVTVGAADSGGAGFKYLKVPN